MRAELAAALIIGSLVAPRVFADNPVISHRHLADPNGFVYNGRIYAICSNDDENGSGYNMKGSVLISTTDLMNWSDHGEVYYAPKDTKWAGGAYAPTAIARSGKIYYYFPNVTSGVGVLVADKPEGPLVDPLGKALVSGTLCDGVAWCFDPDVFVDDDGQAYLVYGGGSNSTYSYGQNIRGIKLGSDMISVSGSPVTIALNKSFEGPFVHKYKGNYYFHFPMSGGADIGYEMSSTSPIAGFTYKGVVLPNPTLDGKNVNLGNNSHESIFEFKGNWYMMYHDRRLTISEGASNYLKRSINIDKLVYNADGTMQKVVVTSGMAQIANFDPYDSTPAVTCSKQRSISAYTDVNNTGVQRINLLVPRKSGAWMRISSADFGTGAKRFEIDGGGTASNATVEVRSDSSGGTLYGTCTVSKTGSWTTRAVSACAMSGLSGVKDVYLRFVGADSSAVFDWWRFVPSSTTSIRQEANAVSSLRSYEVYDVRGVPVRRFSVPWGTPSATAWRENCAGIAPGLYVARIQDVSGGRTETFFQPDRR